MHRTEKYKKLKVYDMVCFALPPSFNRYIKARGRAICRAVDTVELLRRAFMKDLQLQGIAITTEEGTKSEGQKANVSAIEIIVTKP